MPMIPTFPTSLHTDNGRMFNALAELNERSITMEMDHPQIEDEMTDRPTLTTGPGHRHSKERELSFTHFFPNRKEKESSVLIFKDKECDIVSDM